MAKPTIITRASKGSALTWTEGDANLTNLQNATITVSDGTNSKAIDLNGTIQFASGTNATVSVNSSTGVVTVSASGGGGLTNAGGTSSVIYPVFVASEGDSTITTAYMSGSVSYDGSLSEFQTYRSSSNFATITGSLKFRDSSSQFATIQPPTTYSAAYTLTLPTSAGSANQVLKTDGSGTLSWTTITSFNPAAPGPIGSTTPSSGNFTGISAGNNNLLISTSGGISMGGTGTTLTMSPATTGNINNTNIGATTPATGKFTTLESTGRTTLKDIKETVYTLTYAATITPDVANGTIQKITLTGNVTFSAFANPVAGQSLTLIVTQDATGSRTLTSTMKFSGGTKTLSTAANSIDIISVFYDGTNYYASLGKGFA